MWRAIPTGESSAYPGERGWRAIRAAAAVSWLSGGAVGAALVTIRYCHVMHPGWQWTGFALTLTFLASAFGLVALVRTVRHRSWLASAIWIAVLVLPPLISTTPLAYGFFAMSAMRRPYAQRRLPLDRGVQQFSGAMGASLLDAASRVAYPRRTSGRHVVMLYKKA